jgi:8-oxo-dGTP diphosphatase
MVGWHVACVVLASSATAACALGRPRCESPATATHAPSAACVVVVDGRLLAIRHRFGGKLGLPGGTAHTGEAARCTAERETWEETGLAVHATVRVGATTSRGHYYWCEPVASVRPHDRPNPPLHSLPEVLGIHWLKPDTLSSDDWRFPAELGWLPALVRDGPGERPQVSEP